ncbi:MAG: NTP transferase domain-containing protein, partial [Sulfuricella sp.]
MITGILLAAGAGTRFGGDKLQFPLPDGTPIGVKAARNLLRESVNTEIPVTISSSCTNGDAAYEDEHLGTQRRIDGDGGFN